jgi:alternate signal-mediated exported protein
MTTKTTKKGAVKGTVAAAAGVAVLLGGMGTFAFATDPSQCEYSAGDVTVVTGAH